MFVNGCACHTAGKLQSLFFHAATSPADARVRTAPSADAPEDRLSAKQLILQDRCWGLRGSTMDPGCRLPSSLRISHRSRLKCRLLTCGDRQQVNRRKVQKCQGRRPTEVGLRGALAALYLSGACAVEASEESCFSVSQRQLCTTESL